MRVPHTNIGSHMLRWVSSGAILASTVLVSTLATPTAGHATDTVPTDQDGRWVAMGDSFQSGVGTGNYRDDSGDCLRSPESHLELLSADGTLPTDLEHVACSGARIDDLYDGRHGEPPQLDALTTETQDISHVSVGIGGNDLDFADNLRDCILQGWPWSSCESRLGEDVEANFADLMDQNPDGLNTFQQLFTDIQDATGPQDTDLLTFTYPKFFPPDGGSDWSSLPLQPRCQGIRISDQLWINNSIQRLNSAIIDSAHSVDATPVDLYEASEGHELCHPDGNDDYLNGIELNSEAFHPTEFGYDRNATQIRDELDEPSNISVPLRTGDVALPEPPQAEVSLDQDGDTVTVAASESVPGDGAIDTHLWEFDDGELIDAAQASHTYDEPGTYNVTLTVIDSNEEMGFSEPHEVVVE